jgi:hypothetical protein
VATQNDDKNHNLVKEEELKRTISVLQQADHAVDDACTSIGCDPIMGVAGAFLSLGEIFLHKRQPQKALEYLEKLETKLVDLIGCDLNARTSMLHAKTTLTQECKDQIHIQPVAG